MPLMAWLRALLPPPPAPIPAPVPEGPPVPLLEQLRADYPHDEFVIPPHPAGLSSEKTASAVDAQSKAANMSILSQVFSQKISFSEGVSEGEQWFSALISNAPTTVQAAAATGLSDFKQAVSDAVGLADTLLGPILATATTTVEAAANTAITAAIGPAFATQLTPSVDAGITSVTNALHAEIDAVAAQVRAKLVTPAPALVTQSAQAAA